jgi:outer membrane protein OmpA-like peptidoglycan-associated protein
VKLIRIALLSAVCLYLPAAITPVAVAETNHVAKARKAKVTGTITSRVDNTINVLDKKDGSTKIVNVSDTTQIQRDGFLSDKKMNATALVPGLTITAKGTTNADGQIDANKVSFRPDAFAVTVAQEQQILANKTAVGLAQTTADQGVSNAAAAQSSADQAQSTANQGVASAEAANTAAAANAIAVKAVDQRVSNLGEYTTVASAGVYFANSSYKLTDNGKAALDQLISSNSNVNGYRIEIAGYTSSTGGKTYNQRLSERRAAAVAQYLRENAGVPMWRILVPAGYGETHPAASNDGSKDRALNRRVEVRIMVSKGLQADSQVASAQP